MTTVTPCHPSSNFHVRVFSIFPFRVSNLIAFSLLLDFLSLIMGRKSIFAISEIQGSEDQINAMKELVEEFHIPSEKLTKISANLSRQMTEGLQQNDTSVPMLPSWIDSHPTGQETGEYLALDLSGKLAFLLLPSFRGTSLLVATMFMQVISHTAFCSSC